MTILHEVITDRMHRSLLRKSNHLSKGIKSIITRGRYSYKLTDVTITHKRTGVITAIADIDLRAMGIWSHMGWFKLPNGPYDYVLATTKAGEISGITKYPSSPGIALPGSAYMMHCKLERR